MLLLFSSDSNLSQVCQVGCHLDPTLHPPAHGILSYLVPILVTHWLAPGGNLVPTFILIPGQISSWQVGCYTME